MRTMSALDRSHELRQLLGEECKILVEFIVRLSDFNRLKLWAELGYGSAWDFLDVRSRSNPAASAIPPNAWNFIICTSTHAVGRPPPRISPSAANFTIFAPQSAASGPHS